MVDNFDTQSWKDRCDRYFTSISESGKNNEQENHTNGSKYAEHEDNAANDQKDTWKDLSEIRKRTSEHWFKRKAKHIFSVLDIHGTRILSKSTGTPSFVVWLIILILCSAGFGVTLYFFLTDMIQKTSYYRTVQVDISRRTSDVVVNICNTNKYKKSAILSSDHEELKSFINGVNGPVSVQEQVSLTNVLDGNSKLKEYLMKNGELSHVIAELENDVIIKEMLKKSSTSLLHRLSLYGRPELLHQVITMNEEDLEKLGHPTEEVLVQCWVDNSECDKRKVQTLVSTEYGKCFSILAARGSNLVQLTLNANTSEYVENLSPESGFIVSVEDSQKTASSWKPVQIPTGFHSDLHIGKLTSVARLDTCTTLETKQECEDRCFRSYVNRLCDCSLEDNASQDQRCQTDKLKFYICIQILRVLHSERLLECQCLQACSEKIYSVELSSMFPLSDQRLMLHSSGKLNTSDSLRENLAILTVHLTPEVFEEYQEHAAYTVFEVLIGVGGLSALVLGISVITVLEVLYLLISCIVQTIDKLKNRSKDLASPRRLSDSEITSITWAVYRQRRRMEEIQKAKAREAVDMHMANNAGYNIVRGNVQNRLSKRNSHSTNNHQGDEAKHQGHVTNDTALQNGYLRRYEGRNSGHNHARTRDSYAKATQKYEQRDTSGLHERSSRTKDGHYNSSVVRTPADNREAALKMPGLVGHKPPPPRAVYYMYDYGNPVYQSPPEDVLYNGPAAYFGPPQISEPVYL